MHRSSARNARLGFWVTAVVVALLTMAIAADRWHPVLAFLFGGFLGAVCGAIVWAIVRIWPVLRLLWWWLPEIALAVTVLYAWTVLARHTPLPVRLATVMGIAGLLLIVGPVRRMLAAWAWCLIVRHRLRVCFTQFIVSNQSGTLPLILAARPTPVGERVWVYLRPGLSHGDLEARLDKIAVACHASAALVERASERSAALLRFDIKRREVLTAKVASPLADVVDPHTPKVAQPRPDAPTALDLPDITTPATAGVNGRKPATHPRPVAVPAAKGEDLTDWI